MIHCSIVSALGKQMDVVLSSETKGDVMRVEFIGQGGMIMDDRSIWILQQSMVRHSSRRILKLTIAADGRGYMGIRP